MLSVGDFGHNNTVFLMKTTLFNAGESYITASISFILTDLCDVDKCK